jgi:hypothetical protein
MNSSRLRVHPLERLLPRTAALGALLLGLALQAAAPPETDARVREYSALGRSVLEMAQTKKIDAGEVRKKVDRMLEIGVLLAKDYAVRFPAGKKLVDTVVAAIPEMRKLPFAEIESEWHDLKHFDKPGNDVGIDLKAEENEHFTDPVHTIVHPLLVLKAAEEQATKPSAENLQNIKEEMEEGIEQAEKMRTALSR